ncbi:O-antigen polymerase [Shewanella sp.]|uniref:O-antigen polymerase n=1 Tax=Shewanella sp. TaxID=50422 RepID=UPI003A880100
MIESFYLLSLIFVLLILKPHPSSMVFVFLVNFLSGFTPIVTTLINYDLVLFDSELVFKLLLAFNISIAIFHIVFLIFRTRKEIFINRNNYKYSRLFFYLFSLAALIVVYQNVSLGVHVISEGYIAGYKSASEQSIKATSFFPFALIFYFLLFLYFLKEKRYIYLFIMSFIVVSYFMYGSRSFFLYTTISILVFLILLKKITYKQCFLLAVLFIPIIVLAGAFREGGDGEGASIFLRMAIELANIPMILSNINVLDDLNQSIILVFLTTLPQSLIVPLGIEPLNSLATEFVLNFDPGWAEAGGGFGFTILGEIYYRFGYFGLLVIPYVIVFFLNHLEKKFLVADVFDRALILTCYYGILMWVRGDFIEISRLLLIVLFFYYAKRMVYRNDR